MTLISKTKTRILLELGKNKLHGYELARKMGLPVTGIYYHLRGLTEEGLIASEEFGRRKVYSLTKKGETLISVLRDSDVRNTRRKSK